MSLTQPVDRAGQSACTQCGSRKVTRLQMQAGNGVHLVFIRCHQCEHQAWFSADGVPFTTEQALAMLPKPGPVRRGPGRSKI